MPLLFNEIMNSYLVLTSLVFTVVLVANSIVAVLQHVFCYPLVSAISSLRGYICYLKNARELNL